MTDEPTLKINTSNDRITVVFKTHEPKRVRARQAHRAGVPHAVMNAEAWTDKKIYAAMSQRLKAAKGQGGVNSTCNDKPRRFFYRDYYFYIIFYRDSVHESVA